MAGHRVLKQGLLRGHEYRAPVVRDKVFQGFKVLHIVDHHEPVVPGPQVALHLGVTIAGMKKSTTHSLISNLQ